MIEQDTKKNFHAAHYIAIVGYAVLFLSVLAAFPFFKFGVWGDVTPVTFLIFLGGGIIWVAYAHLPLHIPLKNLPLPILFWLALSVWAIFVSFFALYPALSLFGGPQLSEGAFLFLVCSGVTLTTFCIQKETKLIRALCFVILFVIFSCTLVNLFGDEKKIQLFKFPDYLGLYAIFIPFLFDRVAILSPRLRPHRNHAVFVGFIFGLLTAYSADNRSAMLIILVFGIGGWFLLKVLSTHLFSWVNWSYATTICVFPLFCLMVVYYVGETYEPVKSGEATTLYSLWSRSLMLQVSLQGFTVTDWTAWLTGKGFGHSLISFNEYLTITGQNLLKPTWDALSRDFVHTHSIPFEIAISGGFPALLLYLSALGSWIFFVSKEDRPIVFATGLSYIAIISIWFQFAVIVPFLGFVVGLSLLPRKNINATPQYRHKLLGVGASIILMGAVLVFSFSNIILDKRFFSITKGVPNWDYLQGHVVFKQSLIEAHQQLVNTENITDEDYSWFANLFNQYEYDINHNPTPLLAITGMIVIAELINTPIGDSRYLRLQTQAKKLWPQTASLILTKAPARFDLLVPYFTYALSEQSNTQNNKLAKMLISKLRQNAPNNPVGLWYDAQTRLEKNATINEKIHAIERMLLAAEKYNLGYYLRIKKQLLHDLYNAHERLISIREEKT